MPDTIEERLAQLGTSLEDATGIGSPASIRGRGDHLRAAHRRRVTMTAATAAVAIIGVGSVVALRPSGNQHEPISPGSAVTQPTPALSSAASPTPSKAPLSAVAAPDAVVYLKQHELTVAKNGQTVRTIPVSAGTAAYPTTTGTFIVADKLEKETLYSPPTSSGTYDVTVYWVIKLDANGPQMYAAPWNEAKFGKIDGSHGDIEMSTDDAQWLYANLKPGDQVQIQ